MSQEHFIKNIEIKNFKLFKDFKAEGFGRVNLIGGKNNVGKTAFMEACYLADIYNESREFINRSIVIELHRNSLDFILQWILDYSQFELKYKQAIISINNIDIKDEFSSRGIDYSKIFKNVAKESSKCTPFEKCLSSFYKKGSPPLIENSSFISIVNNFNNYLVNFIDEIKLADREDDLNKALKNFFDIEKIDIIKNQVMLKKDSKYLMLSEYGDGVKHFLNIILALYLNKNDILYLDEIENGIHYSNYDTLWKIILTISKEQNVQVFATTHSKECIESYSRVAKELKEKDITFFKLGRNEQNELKGMVYPYDWFIDSIEQEEEVRGW